MKEKGGFGNLKLQRDEVTQVTHVGSEIKTGGDLSLVSLGDQHYQVAKLDSGKGISRDDIPNVVMSALERGKLSEPMVRLMFIALRTMVLSKTSQLGLAQTASWFEAKGKKGTDLFIGLTSSFRYKE